MLGSLILKRTIMKNLITENTSYLLGESLEELHDQTLEWLKELDFIEEEISFLYHILKKERVNLQLPTIEVANLEKEYVTFHAERVNTLRKECRQHEINLSILLRVRARTTDHEFRIAHEKIHKDFADVRDRYRSIKRELFRQVTNAHQFRAKDEDHVFT